jgi:hypothetical protein
VAILILFTIRKPKKEPSAEEAVVLEAESNGGKCETLKLFLTISLKLFF